MFTMHSLNVHNVELKRSQCAVETFTMHSLKVHNVEFKCSQCTV